MKDLLEYILKSISGSDDFSINEDSADGVIKFSVSVPKEMMGLVIGKEGKVVRSIRNLLKVRATLEKTLVNLEIVERV